jgi:hypothetical protein
MEKMMATKKVLAVIVVSLALVAPYASAEGDIIDNVVKACEKEITNYCSQVTPGDGRLLACFYAHGDKISGSCEYALYTAAGDLEQFAEAITYLATECHDDLLKYCGEVKMGEGRVGTCLLEHQMEVTEACKKAIDDTELEVVE